MKRRNNFGVLFFADPPGGGDGAPAGGGGPATTVVVNPPAPRVQDQSPTDASVQAMIARHRGPENAVRELMAQTYRLRRGKRIMEGKASPDEIRSVLPDGLYLIDKAQSDEIAAFRALGKPDEVKQRLENGTKLQSQLEAQAKEQARRDGAEAAGYSPAVFAKLAEAENLHVELRDETVDGKPVKKAFVRKADKANDPLVALNEYVENNLADFLPALTTVKSGNASQNNGVRMVTQQGGSGNKGGSSAVDKWKQDKARETAAQDAQNPLLTKPASTATT